MHVRECVETVQCQYLSTQEKGLCAENEGLNEAGVMGWAPDMVHSDPDGEACW